ncbi:MAG: glutathione peroxidase [Alphaproteobacteria bacterium]|nr:MAG: glutathione peroxidase [Alphaproteobacteria bacterium]TAF15954.1 MAG: glutathione peroxidase [Alphaproteobacteria bacterium]TAF41952.1 MAG: glutathione peroxidase [Alphaproteobacteria bacterium]TAF76797.1 MAG: glutathione peroxidase [Alphaproteobacteria bacterium]
MESSASKTPLTMKFTTIDGKEFSLADQRGKVLLIVNTASRCGFAKQYKGLQQLWERYRDRGLVVLAIPSNDFGSQEPLDGASLKEFCDINYNITFPIMAKTQVRGKDAHPFYQHVREQFGFSGAPKWNFHKYVIDRNGHLIDWFSSLTAPNADALTETIEQLLNEPVESRQASQ